MCVCVVDDHPRKKVISLKGEKRSLRLDYVKSIFASWVYSVYYTRMPRIYVVYICSLYVKNAVAFPGGTRLFFYLLFFYGTRPFLGVFIFFLVIFPFDMPFMHPRVTTHDNRIRGPVGAPFERQRDVENFVGDVFEGSAKQWQTALIRKNFSVRRGRFKTA